MKIPKYRKAKTNPFCIFIAARIISNIVEKNKCLFSKVISKSTWVQNIRLSLNPRDEYKRIDGKRKLIPRISRFLFKGIYCFKNMYKKNKYNLLIKPMVAKVEIDGIGIKEYKIAGRPLLNE